MKAVIHIAMGKLFPRLAGDLVMVGQETPDARGKLEAAANLLRNASFSVETQLEEGEPMRSLHAMPRPITPTCW